MKKLVFALTISALLSSCGFRLKGHYYLPTSMQAIFVSSQKSFSPLKEQVTKRLKQNQVTILSANSQDKAEIHILPESFQRRTLSLFPNGQVAEYELIYIAEYQVILPGKDPQAYKVELSREFQDDPNNALAKERERALILSELRVIASDRVVAQLTMMQ